MQKKLEEASAQYYAQAILDIGKAEKAVDLLETEFKTLREAVISDLDLKKYLTDPSVEKLSKIDMALKVLGEDASISIRTTFVILIMADIIEEIEEIYNIFVGFVSDIVLILPEDVGISVALTSFYSELKFLGTRDETFVSPLEQSSEGYDLAERKIKLETVCFVSDIKVKSEPA